VPKEDIRLRLMSDMISSCSLHASHWPFVSGVSLY